MEAVEKAVEEISAEISRLKEQRHAAQKQAELAGARLKELSDRRPALRLNTVSTERGEAEKLACVMDDLVEALDKESEALSHTMARAEDATLELDRLIMKAEVQCHQAKKRLAQRRYEAFCVERYAHDEDAEEVVGVLVEVLDRLEGLYGEQDRAAIEAGHPSPQDPCYTIENWLARRLHRWLPLDSPEKYNAPLPELDPLALKPETKRESPGVEGANGWDGSKKPGAASMVSRNH
jgi:hypothetical protein